MCALGTVVAKEVFNGGAVELGLREDRHFDAACVDKDLFKAWTFLKFR